MLGSLQERQIKSQLEDWFHGYEIKRASNHLDKISLPPIYNLKSFKQFLGIRYRKEYEVIEQEIGFTQLLNYEYRYDNIWHGRVREYYNIQCAVDESRKIVYWKAQHVDTKLQYNRAFRG